jgi:hypothetical protein
LFPPSFERATDLFLSHLNRYLADDTAGPALRRIIENIQAFDYQADLNQVLKLRDACEALAQRSAAMADALTQALQARETAAHEAQQQREAEADQLADRRYRDELRKLERRTL